MAKSTPLKPGDHVVLRPSDEPDGLVVRGKIESRTWNGFTQDYQYGVAVPEQGGERHEVVVVHDFEIWGCSTTAPPTDHVNTWESAIRRMLASMRLALPGVLRHESVRHCGVACGGACHHRLTRYPASPRSAERLGSV